MKPKDETVAEALFAVAHPDCADDLGAFEDEMAALFGTLQAAKFDTSGLSVGDLLRRDYKQYTVGTHTYNFPLFCWGGRGGAGCCCCCCWC